MSSLTKKFKLEKEEDVKHNNKQYTLDEMVDGIETFRDILKYIANHKNVWEATVLESDKAFGDIRHYCELQYPTDRKGKTKICQLLHKISVERREAKDKLKVLDSLLTSPFMEQKMLNQLYVVSNHIQKEKNRNRVYVPRVLTELFEENIDG